MTTFMVKPTQVEESFWDFRGTDSDRTVQRVYRPCEGETCGWRGGRDSTPVFCTSKAVAEGFCAWHHRAARYSAAAAVPLRDARQKSVSSVNQRAHGSKKRKALAAIAASGRIPTMEDAGVELGVMP